MSKESIDIINARATLRRYPNHNMNQACTLTWAVQKSLSTDSTPQAEGGAGIDNINGIFRHPLGNCYEEA